MVNGGDRTPRSRGVNLLPFLVLGLLLVTALLFRIALLSSASVDLRPYPDATEYAASAVSLARDLGLTLPIGDGLYPARYPYGFPAMLAVGYTIGFSVERFHLIVLGLNLLSILLTFSLALLAGSRTWPALVAAAVVVFSPVHIHVGTRVLSESASLVVVLAAFCMAVIAGRNSDRRSALAMILAAGFLAGLAAAVRYPNVMVMPALLGFVLWQLRAPTSRRLSTPYSRGRGAERLSGMWWLRLKTVLVFCAGFLAALLPQLWFNIQNFGHPLTTGYTYWSMKFRTVETLFAPHFVVHPQDPEYGNVYYYLKHVSGMAFEPSFQQLYGLSAFILGIIGLYSLWRRKHRLSLHLTGLGFCLATLMLMLFYYGQTTRLIIGLLPWLALWAAEGAFALWSRPSGSPMRRTCRTAALLLVFCSLQPILYVFAFTFVDGGFRHAGRVLSALRAAGEEEPHALWLRRVVHPRALVISNLSPVLNQLWLEGDGAREVIQLSRLDGRYVRFLLNASFRGTGPPLPPSGAAGSKDRGDILRPLVMENGGLDRWRRSQVERAFESGRPVMVVYTSERVPREAGIHGLRRHFDLRVIDRLRDVRLLEVEKIRLLTTTDDTGLYAADIV